MVCLTIVRIRFMSQAPALPSTRPPRAYAVIAAGVLAISMAAIFIRLAQGEGVPSPLIAAARLTLAALILTPPVLRRYRGELRKLSRPDLLLAGVSGLFLAVHFATWIMSLEHVSVLISGVLVTTSPLWVALLERVFLKTRLSQLVIAGLIVALIGGVVVGLPSGGTIEIGKNPPLGALLATIGAIGVAVYYVIGRKLRRELSLLPYIWLVYGCAAALLLALVLLLGIPVTGYSAKGYLWLVALALVPQLIGHSSFNYALKFIPATFVSLITQLEPVLSGLAAWVVFREVPGALQVVGSAIILAGVTLAIWGQGRK